MGGRQPREALLAAAQFGGQVGVLAIAAEDLVFGGIGGLGVGQQRAGLGSRAAISASTHSSLSISRP
jgi:hypothetical protein